MPKKKLTFTSHILLALLAGIDLAEDFITFRQKLRGMSVVKDKTVDVLLHRLIARGWIKEIDKNGELFLKLSKNGEIQALLAKAKIQKQQHWDGKWRVVFFDIPEVAKEKRNQLRRLLLESGFKKMQASAYIHPYPLNREAVLYLKESKLNSFIRIAKIEELDNDEDFKKMFGLNKGDKN